MQRFGATFGMVVGLTIHATAHAEASFAQPPGSNDAYIEKVVRLRTEAAAIAFDPKKLFDDRAGGSDIVTIAYTGDDFAWPVFSIAIGRGCLHTEKKGPHCASRRVARMVRAPAPPNLLRPRQRGSHLMQRVLRSDGPVRAALDGAGLEWVEADLNSCPGATERWTDGNAIKWVPPEVFTSGRDELRGIVMHADNVEVAFHHFARQSRYSGYVAEGSPAQWAVDLAEALERCWLPLTAVAPWQR